MTNHYRTQQKQFGNQNQLSKDLWPKNLSLQDTADYIDAKVSKFSETLVEQKMKASQLRKFYHELKAYESKFKASNNEDDLKLALALFKAKVAYNVKRKASNVPQLFYSFTEHCLNLINNSNSKQLYFANFLKIMEAVVAFHKYIGGEE